MALFNVQQMKQQARMGAHDQDQPQIQPSPAKDMQAIQDSWQREMRMHLFILIPPQHFRCAINARAGTMRHITICIHVNTYPSIYGGSSSYIYVLCALVCVLMHVQCPVSRVPCPGPRQSLITFRTQRHKNNKCK